MDEKTVTMMEGVAREWRVRVQDAAGNVLDPAGFSFYGGAADGMQVPRRMQVRVEGDVVVLVLPGLWMSGRCWRYQVLCQDVLTGVEWVLCQGDVVLERRVACNGPALHQDAVLVDAVLDSELEQVDVYLGDSTAATAEAARLAVAAREGAEAGAARSVDAAAKAEALKGVALDAAAKAALSAEGAGESAREAGDAAAEAAGCARDAETKAAEAEASRVAAEAAAKLAGARAAEAEASAKVAADAVSDALAARDEAEAARGGAEEAMRAAGARAGEAEDSAAAAGVARAGAEDALGRAEAARAEAEAARVKAEQEAAKAEQNAALLGDAALTGADNVFTGKHTLNGDVVLNGMLRGAMLAKINYLQHKYDTCKTVADMQAIDPNFNADLNTGYITCLPSYEGNGYLGVLRVNLPYMPALKEFKRICYNQCEEVHFYNPMVSVNNAYDNGVFLENKYCKRYMKRMYAVLPNAVCVNNLCDWETALEEFHCEELPKCVTTTYYWCSMFWRAGLKEFHTRMPALKFGGGSAYGMFQECKQLRVCSVSFPSLVQGERMFDGTILDAASACTILDGLQVAGEPDWSGYQGNGSQKVPWILTIGIHIDHQNDETVLAAIANAESKGWTLTVQWNGTPTAQASTMAFGQRIYAKVTEAVRPDGTVEKLMDWGHYLTAPEGYESFRSLESAYRYFGIEMTEE